MKKLILILLALLAIPTTVATAADISNAAYVGRIAVSNNGTATTNVATNMSLSSTYLINNFGLQSDLSDIAMLNSASADVTFMPGSGSNPWILWVPSISGGTTIDNRLYMRDVTGSTMAFFPDPSGTGVTTTDHASMEIGDNGTITTTGRLNVDSGGAIFLKEDAIAAWNSNSGNVTAGIADNVSPTSFADTGGTWSNEANAYDGDTGTYAQESTPATSWGNYLDLTFGGAFSNGIRYYMNGYGAGTVNQTEISIYYDGAWHSTYNGTFTNLAWTEISYDYQVVSGVRIRFYNAGGSPNNSRVHEIEFMGFGADVYLTGLSSGEQTVVTRLSSYFSLMELAIDEQADNLIWNSNFEVGTPPTGWTSAGANTITRDGTKYVTGSYSLKSVTTSIRETTHTLTDYAPAHSGETLTFGAWVWCDAATKARLRILGAGLSETFSSFHTGSSTWEWLTVSGTLPNPATTLFVQLQVWTYTAYMDGAVLIEGNSIPAAYISNPPSTAALSSGIPDNANDWQLFTNGAFDYVESFSLAVDGTDAVSYDFNTYLSSATITDDAGSNDGTLTFRTTSSDPDVSASLVSLQPVTQATANSSALGWASMITSAPDEPSTMYTEDTAPGFFFTPLVNTLLDFGGVSRFFFWSNFAFIIILLGGMLAFRIHPSLLVKIVVMGALMILFAIPGINIYGGYVVLYFGFFAFGILVASRSYGI